MANVRDSDTSLWLHNKLGISNDSWTGGSICSQLNAEVLRNIKDCFPDLQTQVKLKLLLSFFHIPRRNLEEWKAELDQILEVAVGDSELWVAMLADALRTYPSTGSLNTEISDVDEVRPIFNDLVSDLRKLVRKQNDHNMLPMECHYLNKAALVSVVGHKLEPLKHFTIKKKPKSALLRADLLQKSIDAASNMNKKSSAPVIPVRSRGMPRKMTDTTPLKGIPSRVPTSGFRSALSSNTNRPPLRGPAGRKEGGVKLLDIADQPLGYAAAKKRKKMQEMEDAKKATENAALQSPPQAPTAAGATTPDYAAGLAPAPTYAPPTPQPTTPSAASTAPTTSIPQPTIQPPATPAVLTPVVTTPSAQQISPPTPAPIPTPQPVAVTQQFIQTLRPVPPLLATTPSGQRTIISTEQVQQVQQQVQAQQIIGTPVVVTQRPIQQPQQTVTHIRIHPQPTSNVLQRRGLALTREQMLEAQDMFRTANKVTRPEKALILGFMAGSRDNPCPHLGNIVTIKLSEDQENVLQPDDTYLTMLVETHFQMNYNNGEWKRIKKYRHVENMVEQIPQNAPTAALV
ncbi:negative elongation factor A [Diabrotica virgifera virgifera]|uniref:Negative elongation factor A n=1 Tax=Diabrotica virgifera virgifera TaxID=50390 RepID=A0A6P7G220_DIAVI|nr:negative elongation factor A [Diabrotica virgifera virgifera]